MFFSGLGSGLIGLGVLFLGLLSLVLGISLGGM